jgi:hypothetical protein
MAVCLSFVSAVAAQEATRLQCTASVSTGANWVDGDWHLNNFVPETYLLSKTAIFEGYACSRLLTAQNRSPELALIGTGRWESNGCYAWGTADDPLPVEFACYEQWVEQNGTLVLSTLKCESELRGELTLTATGEFIRVNTVAALYAQLFRGDSVYLQLGACTPRE